MNVNTAAAYRKCLVSHGTDFKDDAISDWKPMESDIE